MNDSLGAVCDSFYVNSRLFLKLELALERDTVFHFFDRIRKEYPSVRKLRQREDGCLLLEEEPGDEGNRRRLMLDRNSLRFGHFAPTDTVVPSFVNPLAAAIASQP